MATLEEKIATILDVLGKPGKNNHRHFHSAPVSIDYDPAENNLQVTDYGIVMYRREKDKILVHREGTWKKIVNGHYSWANAVKAERYRTGIPK